MMWINCPGPGWQLFAKPVPESVVGVDVLALGFGIEDFGRIRVAVQDAIPLKWWRGASMRWSPEVEDGARLAESLRAPGLSHGWV